MTKLTKQQFLERQAAYFLDMCNCDDDTAIEERDDIVLAFKRARRAGNANQELLELENDEKLCKLCWRRINKLKDTFRNCNDRANATLEKYGYSVHYCGIYPTIGKRTETGGIHSTVSIYTWGE
jgi:hypothetical protein